MKRKSYTYRRLVQRMALGFAVVGVLLGFSWAATTGRLPIAWARRLACPTGRAPHNVRLVWRVSAALYVLSLAVGYLGAPVARLLWR